MLDEIAEKPTNTGVLSGANASTKRREKSSLQKIWRRERDSNPRYVAVYTLSRRAPSATRPSLRRVV